MTNHEFVKTAWEIDRPEELFEIFLGATVSASMLIRSQSKDRIKNINAYMTEKVASEFQAEAGFEVPVSIAVVTAE